MIPMEDEFVPGHLIPGTSYRMVRELGKGAMGAVQEVRDITVDAPYVMKTLLPNLIKNQNAVALMRQEARTLANLIHENIVRVFTAGVTAGGTPYFIMDRLTGSTLQGYLYKRQESPPVLTVIDLVVQALRGLECAHERGIVHRDIKPENIFLHLADLGTASGGVLPNETRVKLLDFGIAKLIEDGQNQDPQAKRRFMGTPLWASPEQIACREIGPKTDIYSIGLVLYYMLSGKLPFQHKSMAEYQAWANSFADPPSIERHRPDIHPALRDAIMRAIDPDPELRPPSASALAAELVRIRALIEKDKNWNLTGATIDLAVRDVYDASGKTTAPVGDESPPPHLPSSIDLARARIGAASTAPAPSATSGAARPPLSISDPGSLRSAAGPSATVEQPHGIPRASSTGPWPAPQFQTGPTPQPTGAPIHPSSISSHGGIAQSVGAELPVHRPWLRYAKAGAMVLGVGLFVAVTSIVVYIKLMPPTSPPQAAAVNAPSAPSSMTPASSTSATAPPASIGAALAAPPSSGAASTFASSAAPAASAVSPVMTPSRPRVRRGGDSAPTTASSGSTPTPGTPPPAPRPVEGPGPAANVDLLGNSWEVPRRDAGAR
ncbi:protein kinase [Pendulispora brunnea]|uniref:non-specific serine/threonine protein kinase n=1 Tax=Pendulispora brunnea TaxID=2905690 RepID=A0ABZ2KKA8_9BACT